MKIFYTKKDRQIVEGLEMLEEAMKIQLDQAKHNLQRDNLLEHQIAWWKARQSHCKYVLNEVQAILAGKRHY